MKNFSRLISNTFIAINALVIVAMMFCAYTSLLHPTTFTGWSYYGMLFPIPLILNALFIPFWLVFKRRAVLLPIVGLAVCGHAVRTFFPLNWPSEPPEGSVKILSYNVMGFGKESDPEQNEILHYIADCDADIVCLQEFHGHSGIINQLMNYYPYTSRENGESTSVGILSRYPIVSSNELEWESKAGRCFAYELLVDTDTVLILNCHLESYQLKVEEREDYSQLVTDAKDMVKNHEADIEAMRSQKAVYTMLTSKLAASDSIRAQQADSIAAYIAAAPHRHKIVCGDFNTPSISYVHDKMCEGLRDAYTMSGNGLGISFNQSKMYFRIDNIMVSPNIRSYKAKVDPYSKASDHYPIYCWLKMD